MNISLNWLKKYIDLEDSIDPKELGLKLTLSTVEVEEVINLAKSLDNVFVGKVTELKKHPDADKLQIAVVDLGKEKVEVVCGGANLSVGMLVPLAKSGAKVKWHGEGDLIELKPTKVRGVMSDGMICASTEIGLGDLFPHGENDIADLSDLELKVGDPLAKSLGLDDSIYDIDNKSLTNRPDLWGHYGMARELSAIYNKKLKEYPLTKFSTSKEVKLKVNVEDQTLCPRYLGVAVKGIKVGESPDWLKKNLQSIGQKPINNIVDITNYILNDLGQPLHAFDADKITDTTINVRKAKQNEVFTTLDGNEHKLIKEDLVIADGKRAVALAGVMGGENSEISAGTTTVIIESANFDATTIRKTANRLDLRTDSATRFEKSLDPNMAEIGLRKAVSIIQELIPEATVVSEIVDMKKFKLDQGPIKLTWDFINNRIGQIIPKDQVLKTLKALGFEVKDTKKEITLKVPIWRATKDVSIKEDIIEEIARIYGYDNIVPVMPSVDIVVPETNQLRQLERTIKNSLKDNANANEIYNYSFVDREFLEKIKQPIDHVEVVNPATENLSLMRKSLVPNLLQNVVDNLRFEDTLNLFEIGKVFLSEVDGDPTAKDSKTYLPAQPLFLSGVVTGENKEDSFIKAKSIVVDLFENLNVKVNLSPAVCDDYWCHPKQTMQISIGKVVLGFITNLHPQIQNILDINTRIGIYQIDLDKLMQFYPQIKKFKEISKYPSVKLDVSILVDEKTVWSDISSIVRAVNKDLITGVDLFDVYKNGKIKEGKKSLTFSITYHNDKRTLEMEEVNKLHNTVIDQLKKGVGADLRS
jgi:phenylalanyl-tRNA synthetase beta chain